MAQRDEESKLLKTGLSDIKKVIAVSSCKGGVGKSTIAINLAFSLQKLGLKVGIFDADVYGPSLPTLLAKEAEKLKSADPDGKTIIPVDYEGLKAMSFGFVKSGQRAVMRGPMASSVVAQLIKSTLWENLDVLVIDMPPGTGDIQITICQEVKVDGAVIVTTPQKLSFIDVVKGIEMFDDLKIPTLATVENMVISFMKSYHECSKCGHKDEVFGTGYHDMLVKQFGITNSFQIPLESAVSKYSDLGSPYVLTVPETFEINQTFLDISKAIITELKKNSETLKSPSVIYRGETQEIVISTEKEAKRIKAYDLRLSCICALCVDEFSGKQKLKKDSVPKDVYPLRLEPKGNYAVAMVWSDGHKSSIYPYKRLLSEEIEGESC